MGEPANVTPLGVEDVEENVTLRVRFVGSHEHPSFFIRSKGCDRREFRRENQAGQYILGLLAHTLLEPFDIILLAAFRDLRGMIILDDFFLDGPSAVRNHQLVFRRECPNPSTLSVSFEYELFRLGVVMRRSGIRADGGGYRERIEFLIILNELIGLCRTIP
jgi:hypothetical protein